MPSLEHQQPIQNKNQSPPQVGTTIDDHFRQILPPLIYLLGVWGVAGTTPLILRQWLVLIQRESNNNNRRQVSACANTGLDVFDATLECDRTSLLLFLSVRTDQGAGWTISLVPLVDSGPIRW